MDTCRCVKHDSERLARIETKLDMFMPMVKQNAEDLKDQGKDITKIKFTGTIFSTIITALGAWFEYRR